MVNMYHYHWTAGGSWDIMVTYPDNADDNQAFEDKLFTNTPNDYDDLRILQIRLHK